MQRLNTIIFPNFKLFEEQFCKPTLIVVQHYSRFKYHVNTKIINNLVRCKKTLRIFIRVYLSRKG